MNWINVGDLIVRDQLDDIDVLSDTGINWSDLDVLSDAGINWMDLDSVK